MGELFYYILNMSITGALVGVIILLIRKIRSIPKRFIILLYLIPFVRFILPFGLSSELSIMRLISSFYGRMIPVSDNSALVFSNLIMQAEDYAPMTFRDGAFLRFIRIAAVAWAIVAALMIIGAAAIYIKTMSELQISELRKKGNKIHYSKEVSMPAVYGVFKPVILLPKKLNGQDVSLILLHENMHILRKDNFRRLAAVAVACVHWFNPMAWVLLKSFLGDMELACDECVMRNLDKGQRREYAQELLKYSEEKNLMVSAFGGISTGKRIENIITYKKLRTTSVVIFSAMIIAMFIILLTNAPV